MPERLEVDAGMAELLREALRLHKFYPALPPDFVSKKLFPNSGLFLNIGRASSSSARENPPGTST